MSLSKKPVDIEDVLEVVDKTVLRPFIAISISLAVWVLGYSWTSRLFQGTLIYTTLVVLYSLIPHLISIALSPHPRKYLFSPPKIDWSEQIVLVTGAAGEIGFTLVQALSTKGARVIALDIKPESDWVFTGDETGSGQSVFYYRCDISKKEEVDSVAERIWKDLGDPTIVVNNAGIVQGKKILDLTEQDIKETVGVNYVSHFWIVKAFLPAMLKTKRGHILTVASVLGLIGCARLTDYCSTKAAIIQFHEALRFELNTQYDAPEIYTTLLLPSFVHGPLFASVTMSNNPFIKFFSPALEARDIVQRMIDRLGVEQSGVIMMPSYVRIVPFMRWIPGLREICQNLSEADHAMDKFVRPGKKAD
ncbi:Hydroxysteroid 17-beta dehydrogenase 11 [Phaffia rhodozyma]|uniref:Short-chain dehydrogenase/reductase 3 n=1 Tax=Phaffia rhodozyma TaxID=264483 RepID=A0A0F7SE47_PHARH|nr:Hydroxysteroid 17-beta dehydrogenase 11 [Phaffia rhodozyma]